MVTLPRKFSPVGSLYYKRREKLSAGQGTISAVFEERGKAIYRPLRLCVEAANGTQYLLNTDFLPPDTDISQLEIGATVAFEATKIGTIHRLHSVMPPLKAAVPSC